MLTSTNFNAFLLKTRQTHQWPQDLKCFASVEFKFVTSRKAITYCFFMPTYPNPLGLFAVVVEVATVAIQTDNANYVAFVEVIFRKWNNVDYQDNLFIEILAPTSKNDAAMHVQTSAKASSSYQPHSTIREQFMKLVTPTFSGSIEHH